MSKIIQAFGAAALSLILFVLLIMGTVHVLGAIREAYQNTTERERVKSEQVQPKCDLPCNCRKFYNLGTWAWADCMGVGRK